MQVPANAISNVTGLLSLQSIATKTSIQHFFIYHCVESTTEDIESVSKTISKAFQYRSRTVNILIQTNVESLRSPSHRVLRASVYLDTSHVLVEFAGTCSLGVFFSVSLMVNGMVLEDETIFFAKNRGGRSGEHPLQHIQR